MGYKESKQSLLELLIELKRVAPQVIKRVCVKYQDGSLVKITLKLTKD